MYKKIQRIWLIVCHRVISFALFTSRTSSYW